MVEFVSGSRLRLEVFFKKILKMSQNSQENICPEVIFYQESFLCNVSEVLAT